MIKLVFQNLISNSIKFKQEGLEPIIIIDWEENDSHYFISVCDNGIGIPEKEHQKVFEMFNRVHSNDSYEGTGMGLSFCKKIVERHHGTIQIDSCSMNQGTKITFSLSKSPS